MPARTRAGPVAESQFRVKTAGSASSFGTTGGTRTTALSRWGTATLTTERSSQKRFTWGVPQAKTKRDKSSHGIQAAAAARGLGWGAVAGAGPSLSCAKRQIVRG